MVATEQDIPAAPPADVKAAGSGAEAAPAPAIDNSPSILGTMVLQEFTPDDYCLWFVNTHNLDFPRRLLARAPYFAPAGWEEGDIDWMMGLGEPGKMIGEVKANAKEGEEKTPEISDAQAEKDEKPAVDEGPGPILFRAFIAARDAYLDANEDYYDSLEERGLAWHQEEFDRDVLPKSKAVLEARWDMIRHYCTVEGIKEPPPQETAEAYKGELWRGYPS